ncbi:MAG TPA: penicillin-binding protein 1A [Casimicrobiaceae bacterium]|nr:penicillin-binding protein 1A [Casimicrobiaceae bacterium]
MLKRWLLYLVSLALGLAVVGGLLGAFVLALLWPTLPSLDKLTDYQPKIPLRVVSADGDLLGEFGEERRAIVSIHDVPDVMKQAILAAEDERFYQHGGVDYLSVLRAALANVSSGTQQGAGTITMQVARNFFLTREKTVTRKLREALLAWKIEASLSKDEILELYVNQIFLGQRAYGFAAAAQMYYGKALKDLTVSEAAMLAGLPKAPSAYNPITNPKRAKSRQLYVLRRMHELRFINDDQLREAQNAPIVVRQAVREVLPVHAESVAEMARQVVFDAYGDEAYTRGLTVWTTIRRVDQDAAYAAVRKGVFDYDRRHGYRGPDAFVNLGDDQAEQEQALDKAFGDTPDSDGLYTAVVLAATPAEVKAVLASGDQVTVTGDGLKFVARALADKTPANQKLRRGAVIRVTRDDKGRYAIGQMPQAEAAFLSVDPEDGAILSLVGGFDFDRSKYNHVTQAFRQPGSSFKPFIYSAALEKGFTPATVVNDAPFFVPAAQAGGQDWEPHNYDGKFEGPMRLRLALAKSKNLVTIRVLQAIGPQYAQDYITRFGFDPKLHPAYLTMGLGAGAATPLQMAVGYSVFANGGYRIAPYLIEKITDSKGNTLSQAKPVVAGANAELAIDPRNAFIMNTLLHDVTVYGTAARVHTELKRNDLAGKTGTTNDMVDAWFCGYNASLVGVAWIGFDQPRTLGNNETGSAAALPIWISYMSKVLKNVPEKAREAPEGVVQVRINPDTGLRDDSSNVSDWFLNEYTPRRSEDSLAPISLPGAPATPDVRNQLF